MMPKLKITIIFSIIIFGFLFFTKISSAAPNISSVSGTWSHNSQITISGSGFGIKNPAAPKVWDSGNHNDSLNARYSEALPFSSVSQYNIAYRTTPFSSPSGSTINAPHSYATKIIAGAHYPASDGSYGWEKGNNVSLTVGNWGNSTSFFMMYFYHIDPNFPDTDYGPNLKEFCANESLTSSYTGDYHYIDYCNGSVPMTNYPNGGWLKDTSVYASCSDTIRTEPLVPNPMRTDVGADADGWEKWDWQVKFGSSGFDKLYVDNLLTLNTPTGYVNGFSVGSATIGGFSRVPTRDPSKSWRYFSDIYMDNTFSRVILANNSNYELATKKEPQIPSVWSDSAITAQVNLGKILSFGTAYLFVFDANNEHNIVGYPVTLGSGGDTTPPAPPSGVTVN